MNLFLHKIYYVHIIGTHVIHYLYYVYCIIYGHNCKIYKTLFSTATHLIQSEISAANTNRIILASFHKTSIHILHTHPYTIYVYIIHYGLPSRVNHIRDMLNF